MGLHQKLSQGAHRRDFLAVQWLRHSALTGEGLYSVPGWGTKIAEATDVKQVPLPLVGRCKNAHLEGMLSRAHPHLPDAESLQLAY